MGGGERGRLLLLGLANKLLLNYSLFFRCSCYFFALMHLASLAHHSSMEYISEANFIIDTAARLLSFQEKKLWPITELQ